jgi:hypothetical protein
MDHSEPVYGSVHDINRDSDPDDGFLYANGTSSETEMKAIDHNDTHTKQPAPEKKKPALHTLKHSHKIVHGGEHGGGHDGVHEGNTEPKVSPKHLTLDQRVFLIVAAGLGFQFMRVHGVPYLMKTYKKSKKSRKSRKSKKSKKSKKSHHTTRTSSTKN